MPEPQGPTWRAAWLGDTLREKRNHKKLKLDTVGEYVGVGASSVRRMETGEYPPKPNEMVLLLNLYGVTGPEREELSKVAEEVAERGWVESLVSKRSFKDFVWAEGKASTILSFQVTIFPGLIQDPEYAEALINVGPSASNKPEAMRLLEARIARGRRLREKGAPTTRFLLHEAVLHQRIDGIPLSAYRAQFRYLLEVAELPNVSLRVAPLAWARHNAAGITTGLTILEMPGIWPTLVHVETPIGGMVAETPDVDSFTGTYDTFWNEGVLDEKQTIRQLDSMLKELDK